MTTHDGTGAVPPPPTGAFPPPPGEPGVSSGMPPPPAAGGAWAGRPSGGFVLSRFSTKRLLIVLGIIVVVGLGAVAMAGFVLLRGTADVLADKVPQDAALYATVYLDPSAGQKLNLRELADKFPAFREAELQRSVDSALADITAETGLTYETDLRPWLGSQLALVVRMDGDRPTVAVLVASKDDALATAALGRLRVGGSGADLNWTESPYRSVTLSVGTLGSVIPVLGSVPVTQVYAYTDRTAIMADDEALARDVIDVILDGQGGLDTSTAYQETVSGLPDDRLGLVYLNAGSLVEVFQREFVWHGPAGALANLEALRGMGLTVAAEGNGLAMEVSVTTDPPATASQAARESAHDNAVMEFAPEDAFLMIAGTGFGEQLEAFADELAGQDPQAREELERMGLVGPDGVAGHLTGDYGLEVGPGTAVMEVRPGQTVVLPAGALMAATDDEARLQAFLDELSGMLPDLVSGFGGDPLAWRQEAYRGATISFLPVEGLDRYGVAPAYAVTEGMAILASSPDEVKAILDARAGEGTVESAPNFQAARGGAPARAATMFYLDIEAIVATVRPGLPSDQATLFEEEVAPNLEPFKAVLVTLTGTSERSTGRMFLLIE